MLKRFRNITLIMAMAMIGVVQSFAPAWACDPCPKPRPDYTIEFPGTPSEQP
jgi:hypothetical protein